MTASLVTLTDPNSQAAEAYRSLRTNLMFADVDHPPRAVVVAGASVADVPNTVAANLAVAMAQSERNTLLVDADLRRPHLHTVFGLDNDRGLTSLALEGDDEAIQQSETPHLSLLPSGPKPNNPADLIESKKMAALLDTLATRYDIVIYSAPPVVAATDAILLASKVDGIVLVMTAGKTRRSDAQAARARLEQIRVNILGTVLTNAPDTGSRGYY